MVVNWIFEFLRKRSFSEFIKCFDLGDRWAEVIFNIATWITVIAAIRLTGVKTHSEDLVQISSGLIVLIYFYFYWNFIGRGAVALAQMERTLTTIVALFLAVGAPFLLFFLYKWFARTVDTINAATQ